MTNVLATSYCKNKQFFDQQSDRRKKLLENELYCRS